MNGTENQESEDVQLDFLIFLSGIARSQIFFLSSFGGAFT